MTSSRLLIFLFAFLGLLPSPQSRQDPASPSPSSLIRSVDGQACSSDLAPTRTGTGSVARFARFRSRLRYIYIERETPKISEIEVAPSTPPVTSQHSLAGLTPLRHIPAHPPLRC